jgi:hypothetical protein
LDERSLRALAEEIDVHADSRPFWAPDLSAFLIGFKRFLFNVLLFLGLLPEEYEPDQVLRELNKESDRGCVMVACSCLDELLRRILLAFLVEVPTSADLVEGFNAPLGTMSTRTAAAYSLGLIHEREFKELEILRRVRNRFAHGVHVSFDMQYVKALCQNSQWQREVTMRARMRHALFIRLRRFL